MISYYETQVKDKGGERKREKVFLSGEVGKDRGRGNSSGGGRSLRRAVTRYCQYYQKLPRGLKNTLLERILDPFDGFNDIKEK